jgi:16S rRNA (cytosine967-C5)-methyltransferase
MGSGSEPEIRSWPHPEADRLMSKRKPSSISPARREAFRILRRVEAGAYASRMISSLPGGLSKPDRGLVEEIVLGVLRWRLWLDRLIELYSKKPANKLDPEALIALRMGIYQLRRLDRIPAWAAVNESVELLKRAGRSSAASFANAVLRRAAKRLWDDPTSRISDPLERLSVEVSHPRWIMERWVERFGLEEARALALANNEPPKLAFRINALRASQSEALAALDADGISYRPSKYVPGAFILESGALLRSKAARDALIYIQDEASQLVSTLLDVGPGQKILDLCAAPGSKSSHIASLTLGDSLIVACDISPRKLSLLASSSRRLGASSIQALALDATKPLPFRHAQFDRVLVDAPCAGTGTLRQNPEIKWRLAPGDIIRLSELQFAILSNAARMTAPGGKLIYSICSVEPEEGERVIGRFLESSNQFRPIVPSASPELITGEGFVRTFPHRHGMDGFFIAVLERYES